MGLKTTNYEVKSKGVILPTAYARIKTLVLNSNGVCNVVFAVQANREAIEELSPIDEIKMNFKWDRQVNMAEEAYTIAKTKVDTFEHYDPETEKTIIETEYGPLYGWEDDII